jgi:hypothetical protein
MLRVNWKVMLLAMVASGMAMTAPCIASDFLQVCKAEIHIDRVNPATPQAMTLPRHNGPPMGLATVAVQVGIQLYIGSAAGDRTFQVRLP